MSSKSASGSTFASEVAIELRGLGKAYSVYDQPTDRLREIVSRGRWAHAQSFWAVRGVDLEVRRGETLGLVGRNGSGKSTLLEMISGTLEPSEGHVSVRGRIAALLELGAGFNSEFTGRENVRLNGAILGLDRKELGERFDEIVAFADIGDFLDRPVKTYSSGMFARLAFAVAIHASPDILVVDEILSVGDEAFQRKCFARIEAIKRGGGSILFVSHSAGTVLDLCDRVLLLDQGEALCLGAPKAVVDAYQRLVHAPSDKIASVRSEIIEAGRRPDVAAGPLEGPGSALLEGAPRGAEESFDPDPDPDPGNSTSEEADDQSGWLDPGLTSKSQIRYDPNGAEIGAPCVFTPGGEPVNCLVPGRSYVFRYSVAFEKDTFDARYHTLVKTVEGLELGGGTHPGIGTPGKAVTAGSEVEVEFTFRCALNAGVYFLNCGVTGGNGEQLHRIVDAVAIRVLPESEASTFGHVHFDHRASVVERPPAMSRRG